jgi:hypothetical protein
LYTTPVSADSGEHNLSCTVGGGSAYLLGGLNLGYDYRRAGLGLMLSGYKFPNNFNCSAHGNFRLCNGSMVLGPEIFLGRMKDDVPVFFHYHKLNTPLTTYYTGLDVFAQGYVSKHFFIKQQYGFTWDLKHVYDRHADPYYENRGTSIEKSKRPDFLFGIGFGWTFNDVPGSESWTRSNYAKSWLSQGTTIGTLLLGAILLVGCALMVD